MTDNRAPLILQTPRLALRELTAGDAGFVLALMTSPGWIAGIGDRGLASEADAARVINDVYRTHYATHGYGLWAMVPHAATTAPIGICGLVRRPHLRCADLGYALVEAAWGHGFVAEAAAAVCVHARDVLAMDELLAVTTPSNLRSRQVLQRLGFVVEVETVDPVWGPSVFYQRTLRV